jgi:hypothetical protein
LLADSGISWAFLAPRCADTHIVIARRIWELHAVEGADVMTQRSVDWQESCSEVRFHAHQEPARILGETLDGAVILQEGLDE